MKLYLTSIIIACSLTGGAMAQDIEIGVSEAFQEKLADDYGERETDRLVEKLQSKMQGAVDRSGVQVDLIKLTIEDAKPNRPTFEQLSDQPGLDPIRSISIGGAKISGVAYDASGEEIASLTYDWYSHDLRDVIGAGPWTDANRAFDRFSRKFVKDLPR